MIDTCPNCLEPLNLSDTQKQKIQKALDKLPPGNLLKLGCPHCQKPFELTPDGTLPSQQIPAGAPKGARKLNVPPPPPPDISWLSTGEIQEKEIIEDTPMALIMMKKRTGLELIMDAFDDEGFLTNSAESLEEGLDLMRFTPFAAVVLHSRFEGESLNNNKFHIFMQKMAMLRRRNIHYTLIGPEFETLYDLQALSNSANLVVNDNQLNNFNIILKKSLHENQKLFGPLVEALINRGRITKSIWQDIKVRAEQKMKSAVLKDLLEAKD